MSLLDQRRKSAAAQSPSPSPSSILLRTGGVSPTRRTSSRKLSSSRTPDAPPSLRRSTSRRISRNNPPHVNHDIAKSQFATMNSRPHTPVHHDSGMPPQFERSSSSLLIFPPPLATASTDTSTTLVNPTSTILQGLIKEQRATRGSRKTIPHLSDDIDHRPPTSHSHSHSHENSPSEKQRRINSLVASGLKQPRDMGIREMDQYVSKMNKLNFDLKLDIFHRTQQIATLEKKMERMHAMEEELERMHYLEDELDELREVEENNQRLREANEQLQSELDRRDQAISEAVELICQLESKVEELRAGRIASIPSATTPVPRDSMTFIADDESEVCTPKAQAFVDIPDRTSSRKGTARRPRKSPSFLREESRSTAALRSLFMAEENKSVRSVSASTMATTLDSMADPQSPRLSILSECSYFSPQDMHPKGADFGQPDHLDQLNLVNNDEADLVASSSNHPSGHLSDRISNWMQLDGDTSQSASNNDNNHRRRTRALSDISRGSQLPVTCLDEPFELNCKSRRSHHHPSPRHPHLADFGGNLPPTPDTMSTFRPAFGNGSNASLPMDRLVGSRAALDTSPSVFARLSRPRSADEITTRPPSITMSDRSDTDDTAASVENNLGSGDQNQVSGLLSSFNHFGRGSAKATRLLGPGSPSNPRLSCYGGDLLFNGEGVENFVSGMHMTRTSSSKSVTPVQVPNESPPSSPLTPSEWLEAAKTEERSEGADDSSIKSDTEEKPLGIPEKHDVAPTTVDEIPTDNSVLSQNPPLRLRAWANDSQPVAEAQPRRRLSLRPRFFTRNRHQQDFQPESMTLNNKGPSPVPDKSLTISKHRRTSSGPGLNSEELLFKSAAGRASSRPLPKPLSDLRPSTASRPVTSESNEPRSKGSLFKNWMKGSHNKDYDVPPTGHAVLARTASERPKSTATIDISTLTLARAGELASPAAEDEPVWRARRRSRRMA
ncbi:hypothetical protein UA08_04687 [Talaromyces atroroseus]|uniref:Uncharacterized protein n=1 Tax=Talaromyces atroroseus TaxID=1441469 RepID=A0A225AFL0_TALAT|nr:hypothetical protein UA08_04687 [Talaromyces atroroseus]OKL60111.1 hypothetical protein UA08_04687 [Talaromyces atroroseus]